MLIEASAMKANDFFQFGIQARDLRKIDESQLPAILVRDSTILANFLRFRVLITHDRILILHVFKQKDRDSNHNSALMYGLRGGLQLGSSNLPYEFRSLETLLLMVISELDIEFQDLCRPVNDVLEALDKDVSLEKLKRLLDVSKQLSAFQQKVKLVRQALHTVLEADNDMAAMYLTDKAAGKPRAEADHEELEMLLENYYEASGEIVEKADNLLSDVEYTHDRSVT
jgi:magnesium transporter